MRFLLTASSLLVLLALPFTAYAGDQPSCFACHPDMSEKVDTAKFQASVHGFLSCTDCHKRFSEFPHMATGKDLSPDVAAIAEKLGAKARIDPAALATCNNCHSRIYQSVMGSVHGAGITKGGNGDGALCVDCHGSAHYINPASKDKNSPANMENVVQTCGECHRDAELANKYGISHNVMKSYEESFHGKKYTLGHQKVPTCVDCHGYHGVVKSDDPESPVSSANAKETCGVCHEGATMKFVSSVTHKEVGPIPHYAELGLTLLTLSVFVFIILHVILEATSDIRNALSRSRKEAQDE